MRKALLITVLALFLIGGVFASGVAHHYYWNDYQERKVFWGIKYSTLCPLASPLLIEVSNLSRRDIATVSANISAYIPGHSSNIVGFPDSSETDLLDGFDARVERIRKMRAEPGGFYSDKIIRSQEVAKFCTPVPVLKRDLPKGVGKQNLEYGFGYSASSPFSKPFSFEFMPL